MQSKNELRQMVRQRKREFSRLQLKELSLAGNQRIITSQRYREASTIMLYASLPDEVDTSLLLSHSLAEGKMVLLPKVTGETTMELRIYKKEQRVRLLYHKVATSNTVFVGIRSKLFYYVLLFEISHHFLHILE